MIGLLFLLVLTPAALGYLIRRLLHPRLNGYALLSFVLGFLAMLAQFALICYPATWKDIPFHIVVLASGILYGAECLLAAVLWMRSLSKRSSGLAGIGDSVRSALRSAVRSPWFWIMILICGFQIARLLFMQTYEPRDSKIYNSLMNDILQNDHLFRNKPGSGRLLETPMDLPLKYVMSPWYAFLPAISKISGLHNLIITNTVMAPYIVLLYFFVLYSLGMYLFKNNREHAFIFTAVCALIHEFTINVSIQSQILLLWPVWGKGVLARLVVPSLILVYVLCFSDKQNEASARFLVPGLICSIAGCALSTMTVVVIPMALGLLGVIWAVRNRSYRPLLISFLSCLPVFVYTAFYWMMAV